MRITEFTLSRLPRIEFGSGVLAKLPGIARGYGDHALLVTGAGSLKASPFWPGVTAGLKAQGMSWLHLAIPGEPSPQMVDEAVRALHTEPIDVVIGIGGGQCAGCCEGDCRPAEARQFGDGSPGGCGA